MGSLCQFRPFCGLLADSVRTDRALLPPPGRPRRGSLHPPAERLRLRRPPEGRCASLRDGPAAHPSPGSAQPGDGAGYEEAEEWDVMTAPHGVDAIEPENRAKPRPGGRGFVSRLTSDGHRSA